jgi:hypothetical protein
MNDGKTQNAGVATDSAPTSCSATFELANGEYISPCHLPKGHKGSHKGVCLGSVCRWPQGYASEYEMWLESQKEMNKPNS